MSSPNFHGILTRIVRTTKQPIEVAIRAEDSRRIWERRVPLTPEAVYKLVSTGKATVKVVSSSRRVFNDLEYRKAGASVVPSLYDTNPNIVLGIKEPPLVEIPLPLSAEHASRSRPPTHLMFSHTAKGQEYNMPLLARFVAPSKASDQSKMLFPRLVDYELLTDENGKRTVGFGWFAGAAGVLESLAAMAQHHLELGIASPFLHTPRPYTLPTIEKLRESLRDIGSSISQHGTPPQLGPFVIGLTGTGQVAQGCLSMLQELPIEMVPVEELENLMTNWAATDVDLRKVYLVHAKASDYLVRIDGGKYDREHYYESPQSYTSLFCDKVAPYLTLFLNGTGWAPSFPRLMTSDQLRTALTRAKSYGGARFTNIGDISCDVGGGLEFLSRSTTLSQPTFNVNLPAHEGLPAVRMMAVDILPASVPLDASHHFSNALEPYLAALIEEETAAKMGGDVTNTTPYQAALTRATIASAGVLASKHAWLQNTVDQAHKPPAPAPPTTSDSNSSDSISNAPNTRSTLTTDKDGPLGVAPLKKKKILMLGSGMVAQPTVDMIAVKSGIELVVASNNLLELQGLAAPHVHVKYVVIDIQKPDTYMDLIRDADVVISLLPAPMHPAIAEKCIKHGTHLVTASYTSPEMHKLNNLAKSRDVLILNEIGLDPGIDHCSALQLIKGIGHASGVGSQGNSASEIVSFTSFCGGLPAPEDSQVPLRYKFSWRPQGVLSAALNKATYLLNTQIKDIPGKNLLQSHFPMLPITKEFELEGLPNRNSTKYMAPYGLNGGNVETFIRGTLRYPGFSSLMNSFSSLGLLNNSNTLILESWETLVWQSLALYPDNYRTTTSTTRTPLALSTLVKPDEVQPLQDALEWLGLARPQMLLESSSGMPPLPKDPMTPLDIFAYLLAHKLKYAPHERDMVVLSHEIITQAARTKESEKASSSSSNDGISSYHSKRPSTVVPATVHTSTLIAYGTKVPNVGFKGERPASAMARTVGIPIALAAILIADGTIRAGAGGWSGVQSPFMPFAYNPILDGLAKVGIQFAESTRSVQRVVSTAELPMRMNSGTVEESLRRSSEARFASGRYFGLEGVGRKVSGNNKAMPFHVNDLDVDKRWKEDEVVEWGWKSSR